MCDDILKETVPNEIKCLILEGFLILFKNNLDGTLMAKGEQQAYIFDENNQYKETLNTNQINFSNYTRCQLNLESQLMNLLNYSKKQKKRGL